MSAQEGMRSIQGVPRLKFGQWKDCTYGGAVTVLMNTIGVPVTYEDVMGLSGACYRICMKENWCLSGGIPQTGYDIETPLFRALGFERYGVEGEDALRQKVIECIDKGVPVACCGPRAEAEWGLITGYANNGTVFFGRSYFDYEGAKGEGEFTDDRYYLANRFPGYIMRFLDRRCPALSHEEALKQSLETCIGTLNQGPSEGPVGDRYFRGYQAYELWIQGLEDPDFRLGDDAGLIGYHLDMLRDARRCARAYLEQSLPLPAEESRGRLERAVELYQGMLAGLDGVAPYHGKEDLWDGWWADGEWSMTRRTGLANVLREVCALERQVETEFRAILGSWNT